MSAVDTIQKALKLLIPSLDYTNASIEKKIIDVVGSYADTEAIERQNTLATIQTALAQQKVTGIEYYRRRAVAYQEGDELLIDPVSQAGYYATVDEEAQIIKQAYIVGSYPQYTLLVNVIGDDGHLAALSESQLASFKTYFTAYQPIGLDLNILSLPVAQITDPGIVIYVSKGTDAAEAVATIQQNLTAHEQVLRKNNVVSLTEIEDVIQQFSQVQAVGFSNIVATETDLSGEQVTVRPMNGIFNLTNGAFTFATQLTTSNIKVLG